MNQPIPLRADPTLLAAAGRRAFVRAVTCVTLAAGAKGSQRKRTDSILKTNWIEDSRAAAVKACRPSPSDQTTAIDYTSACSNAALVGKLIAKASGAMRRASATRSDCIPCA